MQYKNLASVMHIVADNEQEKVYGKTRKAASRTPVVTSGNVERLKTLLYPKINSCKKKRPDRGQTLDDRLLELEDEFDGGRFPVTQ